jgi:hypothetical protein
MPINSGLKWQWIQSNDLIINMKFVLQRYTNLSAKTLNIPLKLKYVWSRLAVCFRGRCSFCYFGRVCCLFCCACRRFLLCICMGVHMCVWVSLCVHVCSRLCWSVVSSLSPCLCVCLFVSLYMCVLVCVGRWCPVC